MIEGKRDREKNNNNKRREIAISGEAVLKLQSHYNTWHRKKKD